MDKRKPTPPPPLRLPPHWSGELQTIREIHTNCIHLFNKDPLPGFGSLTSVQIKRFIDVLSLL